MVFDSPVLRFFVAYDGAGFAQIVGTIFEPEDYGVAFPNGSQLRKHLTGDCCPSGRTAPTQ